MKTSALRFPAATAKHPPRYEDLPDLCTVEDAMAFLQLSRNGAYALIQRGAIPSIKFGRVIRIPKKALLEARHGE